MREIETLGRRVAGTGHAAELERHGSRPPTPGPGVSRPSPDRRARPSRRASRRGTAATFRLTARGAVLGLFATCFLTLLLAAVTGWTALPDLAFVVGCGAGAWYTKRGALLPLAVSPPLIFFLSCLLAQWLTAAGTFATLTGIFVTLGTSAPWLYLGTALTIAIGLYRGLGSEIADLLIDLRDLVFNR
jgi:hypothetical protein